MSLNHGYLVPALNLIKCPLGLIPLGSSWSFSINKPAQTISFIFQSCFRDMSKISLEYKLKPNGIADLSTMLNEIKSINENWSLNGMLVHLVSVSFVEF